MWGWASEGSSGRTRYSRQEMTKVVLPRPGDGVSPALLGGLSDHLVVNFEGEILLGLQGLESLEEGGPHEGVLAGKHSRQPLA
jgi:hypothetical protein